MNKKGMAEVILVVLIILLSIASITIFSAAILGPARQLSPQLSCTELRIQQPLEIRMACFDQDSGEIRATIQRSLNDVEISKIIFRGIGSEGALEEWCCGGSTCSECIIQERGATKTYTLEEVRMQSPETLIIEVDQCVLQSSEVEPCV
ncbi:hypothetical protein CO038_01305 [Candidatus Pacearchaeota archaeon CG_4_9_14_0_2_um_filter_39_13]|nr:hypothetical protein [Candidatus Pacearchaeota archaeon]OIO43225.1 MAG: hypothetical protein AUJ64_02725 [Candidatus Pacearchaeota archaeon CG1_02_39_14]PJC44926.1 MAG: hypothetical protein CO038_01305 [Candidatus Pacearchaeota archaeon CG_4_9_14_0_2_um_filter_39_13]